MLKIISKIDQLIQYLLRLSLIILFFFWSYVSFFTFIIFDENFNLSAVNKKMYMTEIYGQPSLLTTMISNIYGIMLIHAIFFIIPICCIYLLIRTFILLIGIKIKKDKTNNLIQSLLLHVYYFIFLVLNALLMTSATVKQGFIPDFMSVLLYSLILFWGLLFSYTIWLKQDKLRNNFAKAFVDYSHVDKKIFLTTIIIMIGIFLIILYMILFAILASGYG